MKRLLKFLLLTALSLLLLTGTFSSAVFAFGSDSASDVIDKLYEGARKNMNVTPIVTPSAADLLSGALNRENPDPETPGERREYKNSETGYTAVIRDDASLLTEEEKEKLLKDMEPITAYGNVVFQSTDHNSSSPRGYVDRNYAGFDGSIFLLDMENRQVGLYNSGAIYKVVTTSHTASITDNVYLYASDKEYYECAAEAFREELILLQGGKIAQPMKLICSILLGLVLGFSINFLILRVQRYPAAPPKETIPIAVSTAAMAASLAVHVYKRERKSSGSSGGGGGGGGFGGGGSSHGF